VRVVPLPEASARPRRLAVGEFDGVHLGHREVIRGADTVVSFDPHPLAIIRPEAAPRLLTSVPVKADLIAALGVDELVIVPFDEEFGHVPPQSFIDEVLVTRLGATHVSVGENFRFGHRAAGDPALLRADGRFQTRVVPLVEAEGEIVSSTHIRGLVAAGDVASAARFLGAPFQMRGPVAHGDKRGRELGFPTANLVPDPAYVVPGHGVYVCLAWPAGAEDPVPAAVNVGVRPTFQTGRGLLVEAYLLDFEGDLYDTELRLDFLRRLRGERAFPSADALVEQMQRDVLDARAAVEESAATVRRP
jgi:riboflavin kinase/FMN adenylyltransferase